MSSVVSGWSRASGNFVIFGKRGITVSIKFPEGSFTRSVSDGRLVGRSVGSTN